MLPTKTETPEKDNVRRIVGKRSGSYRRSLSVLHVQLDPVVVGIKKQRGNSPMHRKSYEKDRQPQSRGLPEKQIAKSEKFSGGLRFLIE